MIKFIKRLITLWRFKKAEFKPGDYIGHANHTSTNIEADIEYLKRGGVKSQNGNSVKIDIMNEIRSTLKPKEMYKVTIIEKIGENHYIGWASIHIDDV